MIIIYHHCYFVKKVFLRMPIMKSLNAANNSNKNVECMCDECEHYLECFPDSGD